MPLLGVALSLSIFGSCGGLLVASSLLLFTHRIRTRLIPWLVSYAVGALLGVALLALAASSFLYVALSDLVPDLHTHGPTGASAIRQVVLIALGMATAMLL